MTTAASMAKLFASEAAMWVTTQAVQLFGGYGYMRDFPVEKLFRDAKATEIYEGTSEIQRILVARGLYPRAKRPRRRAGRGPAGEATPRPARPGAPGVRRPRALGAQPAAAQGAARTGCAAGRPPEPP